MRSRQKPALANNVLGIAFLVALIGFFAVLLTQGHWMKVGAEMFLNNSPIVAPVYPLFLRIFRLIFGEGFLTAVIFFQLLFGFSVCFWFAHTLGKFFSLPNYIKYLITFLLLLPYFPVLRFGNAIASEGLAYPLFLVVVKYMLEGLLQQKTSSLIKAFLWCSLLILIRKQFIVFYPLFVLLLVYIYILTPTVFRKYTLLLILVISVAATQVIERSWQYLRDDHFRTIPTTGLQLVTAPLFVSKAGDGDFLASEQQKIIFEKTHVQLAEKGLLKGSSIGREDLFLQPIDHFIAAYNAIMWFTLLPVLREQGVENWYQIDTITLEMAWTLARQNMRDYLLLYRRNIVNGVGGKSHALFLIFFTLLAIGFHFVYRDGLSLAAAVVSILNIGNLLLVAMAEPVLPRYIIYTWNLQICFYLLVAFESFRNGARNSFSL